MIDIDAEYDILWGKGEKEEICAMFYHAKNGNVKIDNTDMDYISFGNGKKTLIMIPGLGDGLKTAKGMAVPFAILYRSFAKDYTVYVFSRKNRLEEGYSTRDMARDLHRAMLQLGIGNADIVGVSQGGMIAQYLAIDFPDVVNKLVLVVTLAKQNAVIQGVIPSWIKMAQEGDYKSLMIDTAEKSYTEKRLKQYRPFYPLMGSVGKPKDFKRFLIMAKACIEHDVYDELDKIKAPTFIIGGDCDKIVGGKASEELAECIHGAKLKMYHGFGHGVYEEAKDFNQVVLEYLR